MKASSLMYGAAAILLGIGSQAALAQDTPAWEHALRSQLLAEQQCNLNYLTNVKIQDLGTVQSIEARAHCMNGQAFDVKSLHGTTRFKIEQCGITVC
jgi:hypothetical protein